MSIVEAPASPDLPPTSQRSPLWRNVGVLRVVLQLAFLVAVVALFAYLFNNLTTGLERQGIRTDFGFLSQPAQFDIQGSDFRATDSTRDAFIVGFRNTVTIAGVGIVLTTIVGILVGVASLSTNWLVRKLATVYVETLRNQPPLLAVVFTYLAVILSLPRIQEATDWGWLILTNRSIAIASPSLDDGSGVFLLVLLGAALVGGAVGWWRTRVNIETGEPHRRILWGGSAFMLIALIGWLALGRPLGIDMPEVAGLRLAGGWTMSAPYAALLIALVIYTASYIAEIVRGSIQAVAKGQNEAATALSLSSFQRLRFVVLPQAFRIAVPPIANQYLNLTKNSSLGLAISVPEISNITFSLISNEKPAPQSIAILMGMYLVLSLSIALITNLINRRFQLVSR